MCICAYAQAETHYCALYQKLDSEASLHVDQFLIFGIPGIYEYLCTSVHTRRLGTHYCALYQKLDSEASLHVTHVLMVRPNTDLG